MSSNNESSSILLAYFNQIEAQVVFGDTKASLLVAGDAILLAIAGNFLTTVSGCSGERLSTGCVTFSTPLMLAIISAMLILVALTHALWAAIPARFYGRFYGSRDFPKEFFLISYVASIKSSEFVDMFRDRTLEDLQTWMLEAIHGKARHAHSKFGFLRVAFQATLLSLAFLACGAILALFTRG